MPAYIPYQQWTPPANAQVVELQGADMRSLRSFYPRIAKALAFPDYFGRNLDALFDALCDQSALPYPHLALVIRQAEQFLSREKPDKRAAAWAVLEAAQLPENRYDDKTFTIVFTID